MVIAKKKLQVTKVKQYSDPLFTERAAGREAEVVKVASRTGQEDRIGK